MIGQSVGKPMGKLKGSSRSQHRISYIAAVLCMRQESHISKPRPFTTMQPQSFIHYFSPRKRPCTASRKQTDSKGPKNKRNRDCQAST